MQFPFCRKFGLTASPCRNDGSGLVMESLFGPVIMTMTYEEAQQAGMVTPMKYTMLRCNWVPSICHKEGVSDVIMKRFAYWRNDARNKVIANFVNAFHKANPDAQILIVVAVMEHALALAQYLPWFKVAYYGGSDLSDLEKRFPKERYPNLDISSYKMTAKQLEIMRAAFAKGTLKWVISTLVFRQGVSFNNLRMLVRADGATSQIMGIQIPGRLARLHEGKAFGYLVDIDDTGCAWSRRRALCREQLYEEQKWQRTTPEGIIHDLSTTIGTHSEGAAGASSTEEH